jgi:hypothetical protein
MMNLPTEVKNARTNWYKGLLRIWASDKLPEAVLHAPKRGFAVPGEWNALPAGANNFRAVNRTVEAGLISPNAWPELRRKKKLLWEVLQIEHSLARGML